MTEFKWANRDWCNSSRVGEAGMCSHPDSSNPVTEGQNAEQQGYTINITFCVSNKTFYITLDILLINW